MKKSLLFDEILPVIEKVSWPLAILGLWAKWDLIKAGDAMLIIGLASLGTVYFLRAYAPAISGEEDSFLIGYMRKVSGISAGITLVGILFKLMSWNEGATLLVVGVVTMAIVVVIMVFSQRMNWLMVAIGALGGLALYVPSETLIRQFHRDDPALVEKLVYQLHHPRDRAAAADVQQYLRQEKTQRP
ncbi:MAG: GldL-related protein [Janthinobacterium lividum]